jgi:hypothetical protein
MFRCKPIFATVAVLAVGTILSVASATSFAGRVGGPMKITGHASPDDYDVYTVRFQANRMAHIYVKSLNRADLDVRVIDPVTGRTVAQDVRAAADAHVDFTPGRTREFIVVVHNYNKTRGTGYVLSTN